MRDESAVAGRVALDSGTVSGIFNSNVDHPCSPWRTRGREGMCRRLEGGGLPHSLCYGSPMPYFLACRKHNTEPISLARSPHRETM